MCEMCDATGYLTEEVYSEIEKARTEFNEVIKGDIPRAGIFSKRLKSD